MPDAEVCGVVQYALQELPSEQRLIATGDIHRVGFSGYGLSKANRWFRKVLGGLVHWLLWCAHGCPGGTDAKATFTVRDLAERCRQSGRPFLCADHSSDEKTATFARCQQPDLVIVLGEPSLIQEALDVPSRGVVRVVAAGTPDPNPAQLQRGTELKIEHFVKGSRTACTLGALSLPRHAHDGPLGITLKCDLIADDLLLQAAKSLGRGSQAQALKEIREWMQVILSPYLNQCASRSQTSSHRNRVRPRYRSTLRLCVQSLLFAPWMMTRNCWRRLRGRYPVLILTHHLVSDRHHRMAIPTETFWHQVRFLQRHYRIVSLSEAAELLDSGNVKVPTVVLTFDDGYCDNFVALRAVAHETEAPVAMFVATQLVEERREFQHDLESGTKDFLPLTWPQIQYWSLRGAEFGSHTRTHFDCGATDRAKLEQEVVGSKRDLEDRLGKPVRFFAFPFGKPENISPEALELVASTYPFFDSSLGGENLPATRARQHLLRKDFYPDPWELELEMQSVFDVVQKHKLRLTRLFGASHAEPLGSKA